MQLTVCVYTAGTTDFSTSLGTLPGTISFLPTESSKTFSVTSIQDSITEGTECFILFLESTNALVVIPESTRRSTVCIQDDDS